MHILISGEIGVGKSTLLNRLLQQLKMPAYGFRTEKSTTNGHVYIHGACGEKHYGEDNLVGLQTAMGMTANTEVFENVGVKPLANIPDGSVVLMDELGFLESSAPRFCRAVQNVLDGPYFVLAAVKPLNTEFLRSVREHKKALLFNITVGNREALYKQVAASALLPICDSVQN